MTKWTCALALIALAGCKGDDVKLTVINAGAEPVRVPTTSKSVLDSYTDARYNVILPPGDSRTFRFSDVDTLHLKVWRVSDGVELITDN